MNKNFVAGFGGALIYTENPKELAEWYNRNLGIQYQHSEDCKSYYCLFTYREDGDPERKRYMVWSINQTEGKTEKKGKTFSINYRVSNMDELIKHLKSSGTEVKGPDVYPEGIFASITDPDGNHIELWEDTSKN